MEEIGVGALVRFGDIGDSLDLGIVRKEMFLGGRLVDREYKFEELIRHAP